MGLTEEEIRRAFENELGQAGAKQGSITGRERKL
jgi:hypothetical protein